MKIPKASHREAMALFRLSVIGDLLARNLGRGELKAELIARSRQRYRPPGSDRTRTFSFKTLERWYYAAKNGDHRALEPQSRARGNGLALSDEQRMMLLDMRREHRSAAAELILSEAVRHGVVAEGQVSVQTVRRMFQTADLPRISRRREDRTDVQRRRWQAASPGDLWHGDVCHIKHDNGDTSLVHGMMDDATRYVVALRPLPREREVDMLVVLVGALLRYPPPKAIFLDNGACYRGDLLALLCKRLEIRLIHARPYDPESRGKMERFWRTMRQRCTDFLPGSASLHDVEVAVTSWLDVDYHRRPHAALLGKSPRTCFRAGLSRQPAPLTAQQLARALEVTETRRVRKDSTFSIGGVTYEVRGAWLAGKTVEVVIDGLTGKPVSATCSDRPICFDICDAVANQRRRRSGPTTASPTSSTPFDPIAGLLERARKETDDE
jgi:transposase InsO family protein